MTLLNDTYLKVYTTEGTTHIFDTISDIDSDLDFIKIERIGKSLLTADQIISILDSDAENANYHDIVGTYSVMKQCLEDAIKVCISSKHLPDLGKSLIDEFFFNLAERGGLIP